MALLCKTGHIFSVFSGFCLLACVFVCVCVRKRESVCVCVCLHERECVPEGICLLQCSVFSVHMHQCVVCGDLQQ